MWHRKELRPLLCLALAGCTMSPLFLVERPLLERSLPRGIAMTDYVETDWMGMKVTVAEKLARLGAYAESDGILRDGTGREIRLIKHEDLALKASPDDVKREQAELRELKQRCTVIEVRPDPTPVAPAATTPAGPPPPTTGLPAAPPLSPSQPPTPAPAAPAQTSGWQAVSK
jgi:hypothetical protein